ncbi:hypothetical protein D3C86_1092470 [compost metagenome]
MEFLAWFGMFLFGIFLGVNTSSVRVTPEDWSRAEEFCAKNDGIDKFIARTIDDNSVVCKNTARFTLEDEKK